MTPRDREVEEFNTPMKVIYTIPCLSCGAYFNIDGPRTLGMGVGFDELSKEDEQAFKSHVCKTCKTQGKVRLH